MKRTLVILLVLVVAGLGALALSLRTPPLARGVGAAGSPGAGSGPAGDTAAAPQRILVIGASRGIGRETAMLAAARGHAVTALSRSAPAMPRSAATVVRGDILDPAAVVAAVRDADAVVIAISAKVGSRDVDLFSRGTRNVLAALADRPEVRVIAVTGIGAGDSAGHGGFGYDRVLKPLLLGAIYADKDRQEALLRASPVAWTIVRPGFLTDDADTTPYLVLERLESDFRSGSISRAQVAQFIVAALEGGAWARRTVFLTR